MESWGQIFTFCVLEHAKKGILKQKIDPETMEPETRRSRNNNEILKQVQDDKSGAFVSSG